MPRDPIASALATARQYAAGGRIVHSNINHNPTEAQKKAGNYAKDHVNIHGLDITIENAKGKPRRGVGKNGKPWSVTMPAHYGYIKKTKGADGDHVDCYVGPNTKSDRVFIIDQKDADKGHFDEHKCMIGFTSRAEAEATYKRGFSDGKGHKRIGNVTEVSVDQFKNWLDSGDTKKPIQKLASGGKVKQSPGDTSMEDLLFQQETDALQDQVRNREYPPEAYMAAKGLNPSGGLGDRMVEHPDYYQWWSPQNDHVKYPGNPPWTAGSFADGGTPDDPYTTKLDPAETDDFAGWKQQYAPHDSGQDYDLQGAYKAGFTPDPESGHFDDRFKKPNHPTFSVYSQYAKDRPDLAGTWVGNQYIPPRTQGNPTDNPAAM
ncbi:MAG TPA: hypothetical protein VIY48_02060, partial [Candidatus Paceibacterota bacterium]